MPGAAVLDTHTHSPFIVWPLRVSSSLTTQMFAVYQWPDRRISALSHHYWSLIIIFPSHTRHSSLFTRLHSMQPISWPPLPVPLPVPPPLPFFPGQLHSYTTHTMPIDPIQSRHPLPFKHFQSPHWIIVIYQPGLPRSVFLSPPRVCAGVLVCQTWPRHTRTRWQLLLQTQPCMQRSHSVRFSENSHMNSFSIFSCSITFCLVCITRICLCQGWHLKLCIQNMEYGIQIQIYIFRYNFNVTGTIKGYILWVSEAGLSCVMWDIVTYWQWCDMTCDTLTWHRLLCHVGITWARRMIQWRDRYEDTSSLLMFQTLIAIIGWYSG